MLSVIGVYGLILVGLGWSGYQATHSPPLLRLAHLAGCAVFLYLGVSLTRLVTL